MNLVPTIATRIGAVPPVAAARAPRGVDGADGPPERFFAMTPPSMEAVMLLTRTRRDRGGAQPATGVKLTPLAK